MVSRWELYGVALGGALGGLALGLCLMLAVEAIADQDPTTDQVPRRVPYSGVLELDGEPITAEGEGALWMRFEILDGPEEGGALVLQQDARVSVHRGRFHVILGEDDGVDNVVQVGDLGEAIVGADDLHLRIIMLGEHDPGNPNNAANAEDDLLLSNAQRLLMSPYAFWATHATSFNVARDLLVGDAAVVGGALTVAGPGSFDNGRVTVGLIAPGAVSIAGAAQVGGEISSPESDVVINDGLVVRDGLQVQPGSTFQTGLHFGAGDDTAWVRYAPNGLANGSELEIGVSDDATDRIRLVAPGGAAFPRRATAPVTCNSDAVGVVYFDTNRGDGRDDAFCYCRLGSGGSYVWTPFNNTDGVCDP